MRSLVVVCAITAALISTLAAPIFAAPVVVPPAQAGAQPVDPAVAQPPSVALPVARRGSTCAFTYNSPPPLPVRHVATCGSATGDGTAARPWRSLAQALAGATAGQVVYVHDDPTLAVDYEATDVRPARPGTRAEPIRLVGAPGEARPTVAKPSGAAVDVPVLRLTQDWWIADGIRVHGDGVGRAAVVLVTGSWVVLRHLEITRADAANAAITMTGGHDVAVLDSLVWEPLVGDAVTGRPARVPTDSRDNQGIVAHDGADRILVRGTESYGHNGDSFQCGDEPGSTSNITIENNRFHQDEENGIDIKDCSGVTIRGNKLYGYYPARPYSTYRSPHGDAIVVHKDGAGVGADRVLIENNRFFRNSRAINVAPEVGTAVVRRNLVFDARADLCGIGAGIKAAGRAVEIYHNTVHRTPAPVDVPGTGCLSQWSASERSAVWVAGSGRTVLWNNIVAAAHRHLTVSGGGTLDAATNLFDVTPAGGAPIGSVIGDPRFVADPAMSDYYTLPGSPAQDRATPVPVAVGDPAVYCADGNAPDIGFLETC